MYGTTYEERAQLAEAKVERLKEENARLRAALAEANKVLTVEDSLNPHYGWAEWLDEHIRPLVTPNAPVQPVAEREL